MLKANVLYGVLFGGFLMLTAPAANGSEPIGPCPKDAREAFDWSDVVLLGEVTDLRKDALGFDSLAEVRVNDLWKATKGLSPVVWVDGSGEPTYPARTFERWKTYLVYAHYLNRPLPEAPLESVALRADSCTDRALLVQDARDDVEFLKARDPGHETQDAFERLRRAFAEWQPCADPSDCAVISGVCGGSVAVPRVFERDVKAYVASRSAAADCEHLIAPTSSAACVEGACVTR